MGCDPLSWLRLVRGWEGSGKDRDVRLVQLKGTLSCSTPKRGSRQRNGCPIVKDRLRFVNQDGRVPVCSRPMHAGEMPEQQPWFVHLRMDSR